MFCQFQPIQDALKYMYIIKNIYKYAMWSIVHHAPQDNKETFENRGMNVDVESTRKCIMITIASQL